MSTYNDLYMFGMDPSSNSVRTMNPMDLNRQDDNSSVSTGFSAVGHQTEFWVDPKVQVSYPYVQGFQNSVPSMNFDYSDASWGNGQKIQSISQLASYPPQSQHNVPDYVVSQCQEVASFDRRKSGTSQAILPSSMAAQSEMSQTWDTPSVSSNSTASANRPFKCVLPECGKSFTKLHNLKSHSRIHMTVKPFKCDYCNYSFRRNHDLKRHTRLHTGVKPFQCKTCGRAFSRSDALKRHIRVEACGEVMQMNGQPALGL